MTSKVASPSIGQSDMMLWIAAGAIGAIGLAWLLMSLLGGGSSEFAVSVSAPDAGASAIDGPVSEPRPDSNTDVAAAALGSAGSELENPLSAAQMAYDAGMLIEPEAYSAWTLFGAALDAEPDSTAAGEGLERVAAALLNRGASAIEQGRYADAASIADRILARLPNHADALDLQAAIETEAARRTERAATLARAAEASAAAAARTGNRAAAGGGETGPAAAERTRNSALAALQEKFTAAVAGNRLLAPADDSALGHVQAMLEQDENDARTIAARDWLIVEMLGRSGQASEATDWDAARTWIEEAERLGAAAEAVAEQRALLTDRLIAAESEKRLPASTLTIAHYEPPEYPRLGLSRQIGGWVDVEFRVTTAGTTRDVTVIEGSHDRLFHSEAVTAVENWRFEPRIFMGRPIEQLVFTRVRFVLAD